MKINSLKISGKYIAAWMVTRMTRLLFSNLLILCINIPKYLLDIAITQSLAIVSIASCIDRPIYMSAEVFFKSG